MSTTDPGRGDVRRTRPDRSFRDTAPQQRMDQPASRGVPAGAATAEERLERILYILPAAARKGGATLDELARALGVPREVVLADIEEVTTREFYHPAGSVNDIQITVESDRVSVWTTGELARPSRLTPRESLALGLGLRMLAAEADDDARRAEMLALARRMEEGLVAPDVQEERAVSSATDFMASAPARPYGDYYPPGAEPLEEAAPSEYEAETAAIAGPYGLDLGDDTFNAAVADAARDRRRCRIRYLKPGDREPQDRVIHPYLLAYADGVWYVVGYDESRGDMRTFRMDRVLSAAMLPEQFERDPSFGQAAYLSRDGRVYCADDEITVEVRYSPHVARWLAERMQVEEQPDGSVIARLDVADPRWLLRHVLQYGADAEVVGPENVKRKAEAVLRQMSA